MGKRRARKTKGVSAATLAGDWRIVEMDLWGRKFMDMEVPAFVRLDKDGNGEFQFGLVSGSLDGRFLDREGKPAVEFSWEGQDELDPVAGRGWAMLEGDDRMVGRIYFHDGDDSGFVARRRKARPPSKRR